VSPSWLSIRVALGFDHDDPSIGFGYSYTPGRSQYVPCIIPKMGIRLLWRGRGVRENLSAHSTCIVPSPNLAGKGDLVVVQVWIYKWIFCQWLFLGPPRDHNINTLINATHDSEQCAHGARLSVGVYWFQIFWLIIIHYLFLPRKVTRILGKYQ
jgi:hypothetical protein